MRWLLTIIYIPFIYYELMALSGLSSPVMKSGKYSIISVFIIGIVCFVFGLIWSIKHLHKSNFTKYFIISLIVFYSCALTWLPIFGVPFYDAYFFFVCLLALCATIITFTLSITISLITRKLKGQQGQSGFEKSGEFEQP